MRDFRGMGIDRIEAIRLVKFASVPNSRGPVHVGVHGADGPLARNYMY